MKGKVQPWLSPAFDDSRYFPLDRYFPIASGRLRCQVEELIALLRRRQLVRSDRMGDDLEEVLLSPEQLRWKLHYKRSHFYC
jgi:hypothetical protein